MRRYNKGMSQIPLNIPETIMALAAAGAAERHVSVEHYIGELIVADRCAEAFPDQHEPLRALLDISAAQLDRGEGRPLDIQKILNASS